MILKVVVDPGHGGRDSGATFSGLKEKNVTLKVCNYINTILLGVPFIKPILTRNTDIYIPVWDRAKFANIHKADFFLSVHCNADPDDDTDPTKEALGQETWIYKGSKKSRLYAEIMKDYVDMCFPDEPFRGIKESETLTVLKKTIMPANLVEIGFIDRSKTNRKFSDDGVLMQIATSLSLGIIEVSHMIEKTKPV
jgi:N-acetylmuramoyl-L-alanine amidase